MLLATRLSAGKATLNRIFAALILTVAIYVIMKNLPAAVGRHLAADSALQHALISGSNSAV